MKIWYRTPPYSRNAASVNKYAAQFKAGDVVDQGDHLFWQQGRPGSWTNEQCSVFSKDCETMRQAVSPSAAEFLEAQAATAPQPAGKVYVITSRIDNQPIPGMFAICGGIQFDPVTGQFWQGGPVIKA